MTGPVTDKSRGFGLSGLISLGISLCTMVQLGQYLFGASSPPSGASNTTHTVARPVLEQTARFFSSASSGLRATAASAVKPLLSGTPLLSGIHSGASAEPALNLARGFSWTTLGLLGFAGAIGTLYLARRYWSSPSPLIHNVNNNNIHINIHFDGKPASIRQEGTNIFVKMPKVFKCGIKESATTAA